LKPVLIRFPHIDDYLLSGGNLAGLERCNIMVRDSRFQLMWTISRNEHILIPGPPTLKGRSLRGFE
jgi:hypothetical protein